MGKSCWTLATRYPRAANTLAGPLRIVDLTFNAGGVTLRWSALAGRDYRVEYKDDWSAVSWTPLPGSENLSAGGSSSLSVIVDMGGAPHQRFYRVRLLDGGG